MRETKYFLPPRRGARIYGERAPNQRDVLSSMASGVTRIRPPLPIKRTRGNLFHLSLRADVLSPNLGSSVLRKGANLFRPRPPTSSRVIRSTHIRLNTSYPLFFTYPAVVRRGRGGYGYFFGLFWGVFRLFRSVLSVTLLLVF